MVMIQFNALFPFHISSTSGGECADDRPIQCEESGGWKPLRDHNASHLCLSGIQQGDVGEWRNS